MNRVPLPDSLIAVLGILTALAIGLTMLGVPPADIRQMIGDLSSVVPLYVLNKTGEGPRLGS